MRHGFFLGAIEARAFEDDVYAELAPRAFLRVLDRIDLDFLSIYDNGILRGLDRMLCFADHAKIRTLRGIVFEQVSEHFRACQVVDGDHFIALGIKHLTECQTSDTAEAVDGNFNRHFEILRNQLIFEMWKFSSIHLLL